MVVWVEDEISVSAPQEGSSKYLAAEYQAYKLQDMVAEIGDKKRHDAAFAEFMDIENEGEERNRRKPRITQRETEAADQGEDGWQTDSGNGSDSDNGNEGDSGAEYGTCYSADATIFTATTGVRTQNGATWEGAYTLNYSSGFAGGAPYSANYKGVREGREDETAVYGVGRTGKRPVKVPETMVEAMRADQRFEVKLHGLPAHRKRQVDETLTFAQEMTDKTLERSTVETSDVKRETGKGDRDAARDGYVCVYLATLSRAAKYEEPYGARPMSDNRHMRPQSGTPGSFIPQSIVELERDGDYDYGFRARPPVQEKQTSLKEGVVKCAIVDKNDNNLMNVFSDTEDEDYDLVVSCERLRVTPDPRPTGRRPSENSVDDIPVSRRPRARTVLSETPPRHNRKEKRYFGRKENKDVTYTVNTARPRPPVSSTAYRTRHSRPIPIQRPKIPASRFGRTPRLNRLVESGDEDEEREDEDDEVEDGDEESEGGDEDSGIV